MVSGKKAVSGLGLDLGLGVRGRPRGMSFPPDSILCLFLDLDLTFLKERLLRTPKL